MQPSFGSFLERRDFLRVLAGGAIAAGTPCLGRAQPPALPASTSYVYKTVGECQIKADVYPAAAAGGRQPAVVFIHGGALIMGSRKWPDRRFLGELASRGLATVSIDYRLAPETKLPGIIQDVQDAWRWVRREGPKSLGIDPERIAVAGGSAGGYLTLMCGFCLEPRPRALVSYFGYGDIITPWYSQPDAFYRRQPLVPKEDAYRAVGQRPLSEPPAQNQRGRFYLYCRQNGIWPNEVTGHDPHREPKWFDPYRPIANVTAKYPATFLIHGTADTDVPYAESKNMAARLAQCSVEHELVTVSGAGHGLSGTKAEEVLRIAQRAADFIKAHTGP
ncbi:MAG: alpha/beta hydrolase [Thermoguttaceae bacterium]